MNRLPRLLLHVCCAPCSTHPVGLLSADYSITGFFFNPNIFPENECLFRMMEVTTYFKRLELPSLPCDQPFSDWKSRTEFLCEEPEGGERCKLCFEYRLNRTAECAAANGIPIFTTTLTIGPNKPASVIFPIGHAVAEKHGVQFLAIDFKKKDGYRKSCEKSREEGMYRQNYCGCEFSLRARQIKNSDSQTSSA